MFAFAEVSWAFWRWLTKQRQRDRGQDPDDQDHDEQLDQRQSRVVTPSASRLTVKVVPVFECSEIV